MIFRVLEWLRGWLMPFPFWLSDLGKRGEYLARRYYHRRGYHCVARNWRHGRGEIDLIMADYRHLLFVEVKTRTLVEELRIGDTLGWHQKNRLIALAKTYVGRLPREVPWSFWLVLVTVGETRGFALESAKLY